MKLTSVSFGQVYAVSGKPSKASALRKELTKVSTIDTISANNHFKTSSSDGLLLQAARRGEDVDIYFTGDDCKKFRNEQAGYTDMNDIIEKVSKYFDLRIVDLKDVKSRILTY